MKPGIQKDCLDCGQAFLSNRKDKKYCSDSCKQMAYLRRNGLATTWTNPNLHAIPLHEDENVIHVKDVKPHQAQSARIKDWNSEPVAQEQQSQIMRGTKSREEEVENTKPGIPDFYSKVESRLHVLIGREADKYRLVGYLSPDILNMWDAFEACNILWVVERQLCLIDSLIKVSNLSFIDVGTFNAIAAGVGKTIKSKTFSETPDNYPFKGGMLELSDWIKQIARANYNPDKIVVRLPQGYKARLMYVRSVLIKVLKPVKFSELSFEESNSVQLTAEREKRDKERQKQINAIRARRAQRTNINKPLN